MLVMPGMKHWIYKSIGTGAPMQHERVLGPGERHTIGKINAVSMHGASVSSIG